MTFELPPWPPGADPRTVAECADGKCERCHELVEIHLRESESVYERAARTGQTTLDAIATDGGRNTEGED